MTSVLLGHPFLLGMNWMDPNWLLDQFGGAFYWISLLIVFIECGLFFPFLPGDTLLFALGLFLNSGRIDMFPGGTVTELLIAFVLLSASAFLGNVVGYEIGRAIGPPLYQREGGLLKKKYFDQTQAFFDKHGNKALVIGRFVPFVRTFITVVAGVTHMDRRRFFLWSLVGAVLWVASILLLGFTLGQAFPGLGENIDKALWVILAFTAVPVAWEWWRHRRASSHRVVERGADRTAANGSGSDAETVGPTAGDPAGLDASSRDA